MRERPNRATGARSSSLGHTYRVKPVGPVEGLLDGERLRAAFTAAAIHLRDRAAAIDAINVYPVPDGDTGTNMSSTLRAAVDATSAVDPVTIEGVLAALARGALYGARGNSGVILSQALKGFAVGVGSRHLLDAAALAAGLQRAALAAYAAVGVPVEGTMLTVLREAAAEASAHANGQLAGGEGLPCTGVLARAIAAAEQAEVRTTEQLESLRAAGLPDAGGEGVCVILRGLLAAVTGTAPVVHLLPPRPAHLSAGQHEEFGFCTEFVVEATAGDIAEGALRSLVAGADYRSLVIVGDPAAWHVHVHTTAPEPLLEAAAALGRIVHRKVEDMDRQNLRWLATGSGAGQLGLLALSRGPGFAAVFEGLGARLMKLGDIEKPSAGDIAAAADALGSAAVIVLPNHKDAILAAKQAVSLAACDLRVVETTSLPQGIAAAMAFLGDDDVDEAAETLRRAATLVTTVEVTTAAADRTVDGIAVARGEAIALVDGVVKAHAAADLDALFDGLRSAGAAEECLVTVYTGGEIRPPQVEHIPDLLRLTFPLATVEVVDGGQGLYPFIASVER